MKQFLLAIFLFYGFSVKAQEIERIEPSSWWIGMKNPKLQLLVHGKDISKYSPSLKYKGVKLIKANKVENSNYLFLDLEISKSAKPGDVVITFKNGANTATAKLALQSRQPGSAERLGYDNSDVIYLITPDRFANGDVSNDNTPDTKEKVNRKHFNGRHGGDIQGIENNLDYIKDMGFTTLWSMPLLENDLKEVTYHGYAITDFYKTDPRYGTNEQFKKMVAKSNQMGLKWIMDVIPNHCGIDHWWMADLPAKDWINNDAKFTPNSHRHEVQQDIHASEKDKASMVRGWFVPTMPDLNQRNPYLATYLTQNVIWWIEYAGLSGLRVDTYPYSEKAFLTDWMKAIRTEYPNINIVGEEWITKPYIISYWLDGTKNADGYQNSIPSMMDFPLQNALVRALTEKEGFHEGLPKLYAALGDDYLYPNPDNMVVFGDNHDMSRLFTQLKEDPQLFKLALAYIATVRGIPQIYYGTEIGITNPDSEEHGVIRADMPGGWPGDTKNAFTGTNLTAQEKDFQDFTKKLFNWRKGASAVHTGKLMHFIPKDGVYAFFRYNDKQKFWTILNKGEKEAVVSFADFAEILPANSKAVDVMDNSSWIKEVKIPAKGFRILELKP